MKFIALLLFFIPLVVLAPTLFTGLPKVFASHPRVNLLTADNFAILAGSAVSDTGTPLYPEMLA